MNLVAGIAEHGAMLAGNAELARFAERLARAFPDLGRVAPLRALGAGFRSLAVETTEGIVFRIGRNATAADGYAREAHLLPALRPALPVPIPEPRWHTGPGEAFPFGVLGYPKLPGLSLHPSRLAGADSGAIAADLAKFLLALHRFPILEAERLGVPAPRGYRREWEALRDDVLPPLRQELTRGEYRAIARWWDGFLADGAMARYAPALVHGDLWYEHVLVDAAGRQVVGILDFEAAAIGDSAQDFATQFYLGEEFTRRVVATYQAMGGELGDEFARRLRRYWELREFGGIQYAARLDDAEELQDSVGKLRRGPILGDGRRV